MPQFGYNQADDPLGIGLQERGRQHRELYGRAAEQNARNHGQLVSYGMPSLNMSPSMEGLFQSLQESGVDNVGAQAGSPLGPLPSTAQPFQAGMGQYAPKSTHLGMAAHGGGDTGMGVPNTYNPHFQSSAVRGLQGAAPGNMRSTRRGF